MSILKMKVPNRRISENHRLPVGEPGKEKTYFVTLGYFFNGSRAVICECFIKHGKEGQELDNLAADAGILISNILQTGFPVTEILGDMTRLPSYGPADQIPGNGSSAEELKPASILGAVLKLIREEQARLDSELVNG